MSAPIARVGDRIEHGQDIPGNVAAMADADTRRWERTPTGHWHTSEDAIEACKTSECYEDSTWKMRRRYPFKVVEVDPEPQPAEPSGVFITLDSRTLALTQRTGGALGVNINGDVFGLADNGTVHVDVPTPEDCCTCGTAPMTYEGPQRDCPIHGEPVEAEPVDLLELVRLYGHEGYQSGFAVGLSDDGGDDHHDGKARRLYDQIKAEVERHAYREQLVALLLDITGVDEAGVLPAAVQNLVTAFRAASPDPSQPVVLRLPEVPEGAVALVDNTGERWTLEPDRVYRWHCATRGVSTSLANVLESYGPVTVEVAPPREPRTNLPCGHLIESCKFEDADGAMVLITVPPATNIDGDLITTPLVWCAQGHGWVSLTAAEYGELDEVVS